jgi:hypothetical protein
MRIGAQQLQRLITLSSVGCMLIVGDRLSKSLVKRGLLADDGKGNWCRITPAGLRALADEMETGRVEDALEVLHREAAKRAKKRTLYEGKAA